MCKYVSKNFSNVIVLMITCIIKYMWYLRRDCDWLQVGCRRVLPRRQLGVDVTVQFVVYVVVADILERCSTGCTFEALYMQVLILDTHKHTTADHTGHSQYGHTTHHHACFRLSILRNLHFPFYLLECNLPLV